MNFPESNDMTDKTGHLLIIEDDTVDQMAFERFARSSDFSFSYLLVNSIKEAKKALQTTRFDAIVSDFFLGDGTTFEILDLKKDMPLVVVTGTGSEEVAVNALKKGAYDYLIKDVEGNYLKMLNVTVEKALRHFQAEKELKKHQARLERLVEERTAELKAEIEERKIVEGKLKEEIKDRKQAERTLYETQIRKDQAVKAGNVGLWDWDLKTNKVQYSAEWKHQIGYRDHEIKDDFHEWQKRVHPDDLEKTLETVNESIRKSKKDHMSEFRFQHKDGDYRWILAQAAILQDKTGAAVRMLGSHIDITESKHREEQIKKALEEKETLLHEIHHRVKNNMQIIASLLDMQLSRKDKLDVETVVKESKGRVYAMAAIHESLHQSDNLSEIDLNAYVQQLSRLLSQTYISRPESVGFDIEVPDMRLPISKANPLGLVLNELISNSLKYAFPDDQEGIIRINASFQDKDIVEIVVSDSGIGLPSGFDWTNATTLGLRLVKDLVERQLNGSINYENQNGLTFTITFNLDSDYRS